MRQEIKEQVKEKVQELKNELNWLLPFGFNRVELKIISGTTLPADLTVSKDDNLFVLSSANRVTKRFISPVTQRYLIARRKRLLFPNY